MSEFKIIETQEQFEAALKDRLARERAKFDGWKSPEELKGWISPEDMKGWTSPDDLKKLTDGHAKELKALQDAVAKAEKTIAEKDTEIAAGAKYRTDLAKTRIALAAGLKIDYADRLRGENEDEWKADAEVLAKDFAATHRTAPLGGPEPVPKNTKQLKENAYKAMLSNLED